MMSPHMGREVGSLEHAAQLGAQLGVEFDQLLLAPATAASQGSRRPPEGQRTSTSDSNGHHQCGLGGSSDCPSRPQPLASSMIINDDSKLTNTSTMMVPYTFPSPSSAQAQRQAEGGARGTPCAVGRTTGRTGTGIDDGP